MLVEPRESAEQFPLPRHADAVTTVPLKLNVRRPVALQIMMINLSFLDRPNDERFNDLDELRYAGGGQTTLPQVQWVTSGLSSIPSRTCSHSHAPNCLSINGLRCYSINLR